MDFVPLTSGFCTFKLWILYLFVFITSLKF
uniref:Uncharacterized protein n=1 Tax=Myoviridae sp. ctZ2t4 TaxID=2827693 RepID=A0A8S5SS54_9CAUD|nr:MAG TPA: hypothetical protein [Myoviridae sp. ctZ2t4]